jgi:hypothetical protein
MTVLRSRSNSITYETGSRTSVTWTRTYCQRERSTDFVSHPRNAYNRFWSLFPWLCSGDRGSYWYCSRFGRSFRAIRLSMKKSKEKRAASDIISAAVYDWSPARSLSAGSGALCVLSIIAKKKKTSVITMRVMSRSARPGQKNALRTLSEVIIARYKTEAIAGTRSYSASTLRNRLIVLQPTKITDIDQMMRANK